MCQNEHFLQKETNHKEELIFLLCMYIIMRIRYCLGAFTQFSYLKKN